jgi:hypothetical protein
MGQCYIRETTAILLSFLCEVIKVLREFVSDHSSHLAYFPELIHLRLGKVREPRLSALTHSLTDLDPIIYENPFSPNYLMKRQWI